MEREAAVYLSFGGAEGRETAAALAEALGPAAAPLRPPGDRVAAPALDALLDARVVVLFPDAEYFARPASAAELRMLVEPFRLAVEDPRRREAAAEALRGVVVALPPDPVAPVLRRLPLPLAQGSWPPAAATRRLSALVRGALAEDPAPLRRRFPDPGAAALLRRTLIDAGRLPASGAPDVLTLPPRVLPPSLSAELVGRERELVRMRAVLTGGVPRCVVEGVPGAGTTRLALEYVHRLAARHHGRVLWIDGRVAGALEPSRVRDFLGVAPADPPPLMVVDEAAGPPPWDELPPAAWLATARPGAGDAWGGVTLRLAPLSPAQSARLLRGDGLPDGLIPEEWERVGAWSAGLPGTLVALKAALRSGALTPSQLARWSREATAAQVLAALQGVLREVRGREMG